jgi:transposase
MEAAVDRLILSDEQWERIAPYLPGKVGDPGRSAADNRMFVEGLLWLARVGAPWRDLAAEFGKCNSVFQRFRRWAVRGVFEGLFKILCGDPDFEYASDRRNHHPRPRPLAPLTLLRNVN